MNKKPLLLLLVLPLAVHLFQLFFLHFNEAFHPKDFAHGFDKSFTTQVSELDFSKLDPILSQPFHYLKHGKQMVALESADGRYVLKLFNPMRPLEKKWYLKWKLWKRYSSIKWISREWFHKKPRLKKLLVRHKLAYEHLRQETGLVFIHASPSEKVIHYLHMTDQKGKKHILSLSETPFVIQEKAILVPQYLQKLLNEHKTEQVNTAITNLHKLFDKRLSVGITDRIQTMENNYGFVGTRPIQIDVGRIRFDPLLKKQSDEEKTRILNNFHSWLGNKFPEITL